VLEAANLERRRTAMAADRAAYEDARRVDGDPWDGRGVHPGRVVATLNRVLSPDTIVTTDAGNFGGWAARGLVMRRPGTFLGSTAGAMGFAIPAAVAASLAGPGRPVVALAGDGGAAMTIAELETAIREGVHPVVLVFDNEQYGTIHDHQVRRGFAPVGTDLGPVDWARVAEGFGALGARVEIDDEFEPALRAALSATVPTVIHLVLDRRWASVDRVDDAVPAELRTAAEPEPEPAAGEPAAGEPAEAAFETVAISGAEEETDRVAAPEVEPGTMVRADAGPDLAPDPVIELPGEAEPGAPRVAEPAPEPEATVETNPEPGSAAAPGPGAVGLPEQDEAADLEPVPAADPVTPAAL
jgi:hypothetical protein